jgi:hypothetical protein
MRRHAMLAAVGSWPMRHRLRAAGMFVALVILNRLLS